MTKFNSHNEQAIVNILLRYWQEIMDIEQAFELLVGKGDARPRIEFFHDAIRAFTIPNKTAADRSRLSIERLSYDVKCLRHIATQPLASITHDKNFSAGSALVPVGAGLLPAQKKTTRETKEQLRELYEKYGVLFAALLKATAEYDYQERSDNLNNEVEQVNQVMDALTKNASAQQINSLIAHLDDEKIKRDLLALLPQMKGKNMSGLIAKLKGETQKKDKVLKVIDSAHHDYATTQLAIYESAKDMLKKMAGQGMNLVGQFVESTMRQTTQGRGR